MVNPGRLGRGLLSGVALSWLVMAACGGIAQRQGTDDDAGGSVSGRAGGSDHGGSSSTSQAGAQPVAGSTTAMTSGGTSIVLVDPSGGPCFNDSDCAGSSCGGDVCNWSKMHPFPSGPKTFVCNPAGTQPKSMDGWCTTDADCKCRSLGAKCAAPYCTFTRAEDAPGPKPAQ